MGGNGIDIFIQWDYRGFDFTFDGWIIMFIEKYVFLFLI